MTSQTWISGVSDQLSRGRRPGLQGAAPAVPFEMSCKLEARRWLIPVRIGDTAGVALTPAPTDGDSVALKLLAHTPSHSSSEGRFYAYRVFFFFVFFFGSGMHIASAGEGGAAVLREVFSFSRSALGKAFLQPEPSVLRPGACSLSHLSVYRSPSCQRNAPYPNAGCLEAIPSGTTACPRVGWCLSLSLVQKVGLFWSCATNTLRSLPRSGHAVC